MSALVFAPQLGDFIPLEQNGFIILLIAAVTLLLMLLLTDPVCCLVAVL